MAETNPQLSPDADLDAQIASLLEQSEEDAEAMKAALSDVPASAAAPGVNNADSATSLDDELANDLLSTISNEIELAVPGPQVMPPKVEGVDAGRLPVAGPALSSTASGAELHATAAASTGTGEPNTTPELEAVLKELESAPTPSASEGVISEMSDAALLASLRADAAPASAAPAAAQVDDVTQVMESLSHELEQPAAQPAASSPSKAPPPATVPAPAPKPSAVKIPPGEFMFVAPDEAEAALRSSGGAPPPASKPPPTPQSVRELDDQLAQAAPKAVEAAIAAAAVQATAQAAAPAQSTPAASSTIAATSGAATGAAPSAAIAAGSTAKSGVAFASGKEPAHATSAAGAAPVSAEPPAPSMLRVLLTRAVALPLRPLAAMHASMGEPARQTIGYVAVMTGFFAMATWAYFLLKDPPHLEAVSDTKTLLKPGDPAPAHGGEHAAKAPAHGDTHAKAEPKTAGHGEPPKSDAGHGGGGHEEAAKGDAHGAKKSEAKKPEPKKSSKKPGKKPAGDAHAAAAGGH